PPRTGAGCARGRPGGGRTAPNRCRPARRRRRTRERPSTGAGGVRCRTGRTPSGRPRLPAPGIIAVVAEDDVLSAVPGNRVVARGAVHVWEVSDAGRPGRLAGRQVHGNARGVGRVIERVVTGTAVHLARYSLSIHENESVVTRPSGQLLEGRKSYVRQKA